MTADNVAGTTRSALESEQRRTFDPSDRLGGAPAPTAIEVIGAVEQRHHARDRLDGRIVIVLANGRQDLAASGHDVMLEAGRFPDDVGHNIEHRLEILRQARAAEGEPVAGDVHPQRHTAKVERLGDLVAGPVDGAAIDDAAEKVGQSERVRGIEQAPGLERQAHGHRWRRPRFVDEHGGTVGEALPDRRQASALSRHSGTNQPTVRLLAVRVAAATRATSSVVTDRMRAGMPR